MNEQPVLKDMSSKQTRFEHLVGAYTDRLYRTAFWLCKNDALAKDLVQETMLRAWRHFDKLQDEAALKAWLTTILRREFYRHIQKDKPTEELFEEHAPGAVTYDTSTSAWALRRALDELADEYREPFILQIIWGYSAKEIGEQLDIKPQTVTTRLFRARKQLREILGEDAMEKVI